MPYNLMNDQKIQFYILPFKSSRQFKLIDEKEQGNLKHSEVMKHYEFFFL